MYARVRSCVHVCVCMQDFDNPTGLRLKYLSLKNLAAIAIEDGNKDEALSFYVQVGR